MYLIQHTQKFKKTTHPLRWKIFVPATVNNAFENCRYEWTVAKRCTYWWWESTWQMWRAVHSDECIMIQQIKLNTIFHLHDAFIRDQENVFTNHWSDMLHHRMIAVMLGIFDGHRIAENKNLMEKGIRKPSVRRKLQMDGGPERGRRNRGNSKFFQPRADVWHILFQLQFMPNSPIHRSLRHD